MARPETAFGEFIHLLFCIGIVYFIAWISGCLETSPEKLEEMLTETRKNISIKKETIKEYEEILKKGDNSASDRIFFWKTILEEDLEKEAQLLRGEDPRMSLFKGLYIIFRDGHFISILILIIFFFALYKLAPLLLVLFGIGHILK